MLVLGVSVTPEEGAPFTQRARKDILRSYRARAVELRPGGGCSYRSSDATTNTIPQTESAAD